MPEVLVIGAGATGLACGHALAKAGVDVQILEASGRAGGVLQTERGGGFLFELGPNTIPASARTFRQLADELGIAGELIVSRPPARKRFLFRGSGLHPLPTGPLSLLRTPLLSGGAKLRLALEPLRKRPPLPEGRNEPTFEALMAERLGKEAATTLAGAFVRGVYAAEAGQLGAASAFPRLWEALQAHGGLLRAMLAGARARRRENPAPLPGPDCKRSDLLSFSDGLARLTHCLADFLGERLRTHAAATRLERVGTEFRVHLADAEPIRAAQVVVALPAQATLAVAGELLQGMDTDLLARLPHASVTVVGLGLEGDPLPEGFGFLVPPGETGPQAPRALGVLFPSRIFPGRAPEGCALATAIYATAELGEDDPIEVAGEDLRRALGTRPAISRTRVQRWEGVIPRYDVGHAPRAARLVESARTAHPGLFLGGNFHGGVSVEDCLTRGRGIAASLTGHLAGVKA